MATLRSRREFLQTASLLSAGAAFGLGNLPTTPVSAIEPIQRPGKPKFKFSLAAYSYRELLKGGQLTLDDFVTDCAAMGLEGTELTSYYFPTDVTNDYLNALKAKCFRLGLNVSGTAVGNNFCLPAGPKRDEQIAMVKRWVDHSAVLTAPVIRIFAGSAAKGQSEDEAHRLTVAAIEECCDYAGKQGVILALENHGGITATAAGLLRLVKDVKSPWFGVNFDSGNFHTDTPYDDLAQIAPYAVNVQVKVVMKPASGGTEPADFKRLAKIISASGYRGYIVLEYEEKGDPRAECPRFMDQVREAFLS